MRGRGSLTGAAGHQDGRLPVAVRSGLEFWAGVVSLQRERVAFPAAYIIMHKLCSY